MLHWDDPVSFIHSLSAHDRRALKALEVQTVGDLLQIFPRRYDDFSHLTSISALQLNEPVTIRATVKEIAQVKTFRRRFVIIRATLSDDTGSIGATWFNQPWLLKQLKPGDEIFISGAVTQRPRFGRGFTSPLWEPVSDETLAAGNVAPVYPLTGSVTQKAIRKLIKSAVSETELPQDWIPEDVLSRLGLPDIAAAYRFVHIPSTSAEAEQGRRRLAFGELLIYQLALRSARREADTAGAPVVEFDEPFAKKFASSLPFELTTDQKKAVWAAVKDMEAARPMRRLLQGDVGSGKTVVAAMLAALVHRSGQSATIMAPTDLLAKQHAISLRRTLAPFQIPVLLLTSSSRVLVQGGEETKLTPTEARERLSQGRIVAVGTHALLEAGSSPPDLALAVIDEQHRFGVEQREALIVSSRSDGKVPHLLSMSATPIPRSLALTMLGDLDVSVIRTKPAGRSPVTTRIYLGPEGREQAYDLIRREVAAGHRVFVVCPLIDPSDVSGAKSVEEESRRLSAGPLQGLRIGVVHGKLPSKDKDEEMGKFVRGETDILVATTVVEVGVDVPEATVMLIEGAERFGLAQLHQLRGRVGRSSLQSYCGLLTTEDQGVAERLRVLERTDDGFEIAEADLKLRGSGNILGLQQSGQAIFKTARFDDLELMAAAREVSAELVSQDPGLENHPLLKQVVEHMRQTSHGE
ncbi:ATP-dependent DNA helicase RecG [Candidatus Uhrbacteria bacterium]|nr:ATP-dependent DNA helicase RecG [Candidatus Uhrbacteria bacterium]